MSAQPANLNPAMVEPANVNPARVWVWVVCTDCEHASQIVLSPNWSDHHVFREPCACGGSRVRLRDLQRQAKLGRKIEVLPS